MELTTKRIEKMLTTRPFGSAEGQAFQEEVVVKYFNFLDPQTFLITDRKQPPDGDWLVYGYCHIYEWEWGLISLWELQSIRVPFGLSIEHDPYCSTKTILRHLKEFGVETTGNGLRRSRLQSASAPRHNM